MHDEEAKKVLPHNPDPPDVCCLRKLVSKHDDSNSQHQRQGFITLQIALNAGGVLAAATEVATLQEALASCEGSVGFTRRAGSVRQVHSSLRRFSEAHPAYLLSSGKHFSSSLLLSSGPSCLQRLLPRAGL